MLLITIGWRIFCCGASCELKLFGGQIGQMGVTNDALVKAAEVGTDIAGAIKTVKNTANELATDVADAFKEAPGEIRAKGAEVANDFATKHYDNCVVRFLVNLGNKI